MSLNLFITYTMCFAIDLNFGCTIRDDIGPFIRVPIGVRSNPLINITALSAHL